MCGHMTTAIKGKGARRNAEAFTMCVLMFVAKFLLTLSTHAQRVTVVVESVCLSLCLSVTPN